MQRLYARQNPGRAHRSRLWRRVAQASVSVLLAGFVLVPQPASALERGDSASPNVGGTDPVIASGWVKVDGVPQPGASVSASIWPNDAALSALAEGDPVSLYQVNPTVANGTGYFELLVDPANLPAQYLSPQGTADLLVKVKNLAGDTASWSLTGQKPNPGGGVYQWKTVAYGVNGTPKFNFEMGTTPTVLDYNAVGVVYADDNGVETVGNGVEPLAVTPDAGCGVPIMGPWFYNRPELWLKVYSWYGAKVTVYETTSSKHTLGFGVSYNAGSTWSAGGTVSKYTGAGDEHDGLYDQMVYNRVNYRDVIYCLTKYRKPMSFSDIIANDLFVLTPNVNFTHLCQKKTAGAKPYKEQGKNVTYATGVSVPGINLSAQAGYDSNGKYQFIVTQTTRICGSTSQGWIYSPQASADRW